MSQEPEYVPAPVPPVSVPVPVVPARTTRIAEPRDAVVLLPRYPGSPHDDLLLLGGSRGEWTVVAIWVLSLPLVLLTVVEELGAFIGAINATGPISNAQYGWTPAREQYLYFAVFGSPLVTAVAIVGAALTRRKGGWWVLWLAAGYVLVVTFLFLARYALRGAPPWE